jgi:hypothetical protein
MRRRRACFAVVVRLRVVRVDVRLVAVVTLLMRFIDFAQASSSAQILSNVQRAVPALTRTTLTRHDSPYLNQTTTHSAQSGSGWGIAFGTSGAEVAPSLACVDDGAVAPLLVGVPVVVAGALLVLVAAEST